MLRDVLYRYQKLYAGSLEDSHASLRLKGNWFEMLCWYFFKNDPGQRQRFEEVWLWADWPGRDGRPDAGIDIVAKLRDGGLCAIQCKFYEPGHCVTKPEIDSFLAASGKEGFVQRVIVSVAGDWNKNAEDAIENQQIPCSRLTLEVMEQSPIDWSAFDLDHLDRVRYQAPKTLRDDQTAALNAVIEGFKTHGRGKLIMACGTGKTFTALKIAERVAGKGGTVLFLVPSIALLNQTLLAWNADQSADISLLSFAVCSDTTVGRKDDEDMKITDLSCPPTTKAADLLRSWNAIPDATKAARMSVIFSTYQSLPVITAAQQEGLPDFDLVICDEAHRTTGVTLAGEEDSNFVRVHKDEYIRAAKRLYMTATPRLYKASQAKKAEEAGAVLCSMDDESLYGPEFYRLSFSRAVKMGLLSDYKVMILAVDERYVSDTAVRAMSGGEIPLDDAAKIVGCWKGLSKQLASADRQALASDPGPMRSAVAFSSTIKNSQRFCANFENIIREFQSAGDGQGDLLNCDVRHVDGKDPVVKRNTLIQWLRESAEGSASESSECRVLSNARCLSEGVDIPALDAILFLNPRKSDVDIVQSVGRVMRKAAGKKFGYVILPVMIPGGVSPDEAMDQNKNYQVVWQVLQALRAHDDEFNTIVNSLDLNKRSDKIIVNVIGRPERDRPDGETLDLPFPPEKWREEIYVRIVEKCGDREYWDQWARDMAVIAQAHAARLRSLLSSGAPGVRETFGAYLHGLRENINESVSEDEAIDMLSQHMITKPVFDALFAGFSENNPVSKTMEAVLKRLEDCGLESETEALASFYESVKERIAIIDNDAARQKIIKDVYERFFQTAFKKTADRLGIVYTPIEVIDFILRSADWALREELHCRDGLSSGDVHILDPFVGAGTSLVRLIQLGLLSPGALEYKYRHELHANEILLLMYYVSAVNIEAAYHDAQEALVPSQRHGGRVPGSAAERRKRRPDEPFTPFPGVVLTDTFNLYDAGDRKLDMTFPENSARAEAQRKSPITVIVGNPPYSVGQSSANDNNQNLIYPSLDKAIMNTYVAKTAATNKNSIYDSYIRAIRWASDRIHERGIVCYVTNGAFLDSNAADGLRKCLYDEFQSIYIFNLRGNAYTQGEIRRKESGNVFGSGSRLPVAITLLVKAPYRAGQKCRLYYHDIGDYLTRNEKLKRIENAKSFGDMARAGQLTELTPNAAGDWINQRSGIFDSFLRLGNKKEPEQTALFEGWYSAGVKTNRDAWCYNFSRDDLEAHMKSMIDVYNQERVRWHKEGAGTSIQDFATQDSHKISWDGTLYVCAEKNRECRFTEDAMRVGLYRPYVKEQVYFDRDLNNSIYLMPSIFPTAAAENRVIYISGIGASKPFTALMTDCLPNVHLLDTGQAFPLYWYEESQSPDDAQGRLFDSAGKAVNGPQERRYIRRDAISDKALSLFRKRYADKSITKEDIFYYVYGVLSSVKYRERFGDDVKKMLARVPFAGDFRAFAEAGRELGGLHVNYEAAEPWPVKIVTAPGAERLRESEPEKFYRVERMKLVKGKEKSIVYNAHITVEGIPDEAWEYVVNGKSALEWIIERYQDSVDKDSGLRNDCNAWGREHGNPRYILDLIERVTRVSVETVRLIRALPELGIEENERRALS